MTSALLIFAWISAATHLIGEYTNRRKLVYLTKPLTTALLLIVAATGTAPDAYRLAIVAGLFFSLFGDIFLMLPRDRFVAGLVSFLIAHIAYIVAFSTGARLFTQPIYVVPYAIVAGVVMVLLWRGLPGALRVPVIVYVIVLVIMATQAVVAPRPAAIGAALFVVSDATLAINRFRAPFRAAEAVIMVTYVAAQTLIALSTR